MFRLSGAGGSFSKNSRGRSSRRIPKGRITWKLHEKINYTSRETCYAGAGVLNENHDGLHDQLHAGPPGNPKSPPYIGWLSSDGSGLGNMGRRNACLLS